MCLGHAMPDAGLLTWWNFFTIWSVSYWLPVTEDVDTPITSAGPVVWTSSHFCFTGPTDRRTRNRTPKETGKRESRRKETEFANAEISSATVLHIRFLANRIMIRARFCVCFSRPGLQTNNVGCSTAFLLRLASELLVPTPAVHLIEGGMNGLYEPVFYLPQEKYGQLCILDSLVSNLNSLISSFLLTSIRERDLELVVMSGFLKNKNYIAISADFRFPSISGKRYKP